MRIALKQFDRVNQYVIDGIRSDEGASCIVYDAHYIDQSGALHMVLLKECYPYDAPIGRDHATGGLLWESQTDREAAIAHFKNNYRNLTGIFERCSTIRDSTARTIDYFECNHTVYYVMDFNYGTSFDRSDDLSLLEVLQIIKELTQIVGEYHKLGYLLIDIKPGNFFVTENTNRVVLFDVDSAIKLSDLKEGKVKYFSTTEKWSAQELKRLKINKIGEATDLYSIGAILFDKLFGHPPVGVISSDLDNMVWNEAIFNGVSDKIIGKVKAILKRTIHSDARSRCQSTEELIEMLDKAIWLLNKSAPISKRILPKKNKFVAGLLAIFLGFFGVHWFYLKRPIRGVVYALLYLLCPYLWLLYMVEGIFFMFAKPRIFDRYRGWYFGDLIRKKLSQKD